MRLYKNCNLECASSTAERTKEHTHTTHGGGKKLVDLCAYVCNTFVLYIAHLVGHFFLLLVGHFYVSFQFYSVFVFEALSVDERCSFYCDMRCSAIIRLFPMLIKWLVRIYISSLSLSLIFPFYHCNLFAFFLERKKNQFTRIVDCCEHARKSEKCVKWLKFSRVHNGRVEINFMDMGKEWA